jgi:hypothetical protein
LYFLPDPQGQSEFLGTSADAALDTAVAPSELEVIKGLFCLRANPGASTSTAAASVLDT